MSINSPRRLQSKSDLSSQDSLNKSKLSTSNLEAHSLELTSRIAAVTDTENKLSFVEVKKAFEAGAKGGEVPAPMLSRGNLSSPGKRVKSSGERLKADSYSQLRPPTDDDSPIGKLKSLEIENQQIKEELHRSETKIIALEVKNTALETRLADITSQLESMEAASARLKEFETENMKALIARNEQLKIRNAALEAKLIDAANQFENLSTAHSKVKVLEKANTTLSSTNLTLEDEVQAIDQERAAFEKTISLLQTQVASLQKFADADKLAQLYIASENEKKNAQELNLLFETKLKQAEKEFVDLKQKHSV